METFQFIVRSTTPIIITVQALDEEDALNVLAVKIKTLFKEGVSLPGPQAFTMVPLPKN